MPLAFGPGDEHIVWPIGVNREEAPPIDEVLEELGDRFQRLQVERAIVAEQDALAPRIPANIRQIGASACERPLIDQAISGESTPPEGLYLLAEETVASYVIVAYTNDMKEFAEFEPEEVYKSRTMDADQRLESLEQFRFRLALDRGLEPEDIQLHEMPI